MPRRQPSRTPPPRATVRSTIEFPAALWEAAKLRAVRERIDFRSVVIAALEAYLKVDTVKRPQTGGRR